MSSTADSLDWKSVEILRALADAESTLTTTEVREATDLSENRIILYRISEHLEPRGLVTTHQPDATGTVVPSKELSLTDDGNDLIADFTAADDRGLTLTDLPDKVRQLSDRLDTTQAEIERLESREQPLTETALEELKDKVDNQQEQLTQLAEKAAAIDATPHGGWDDEQHEEFRRLRLGMYGMRDYLFDTTELDAAMLDEYIEGSQNRENE